MKQVGQVEIPAKRRFLAVLQVGKKSSLMLPSFHPLRMHKVGSL